MSRTLGVAEAKRYVSEIIDRVQRGLRVIVLRLGRPAAALVAPEGFHDRSTEKPIGLAAFAGALSDWPEIDRVVKDLYAARRRARDRRAPRLE